ncbi:unnamed protein product, partial [Rotaria magnacalcarata]
MNIVIKSAIFTIVSVIIIYALYTANNLRLLQILINPLIPPTESKLKLTNVSAFKQLALTFETDKVTTHHYERMYEKYLSNYKNSHIKFLEIGLGCQQPVIGSSARLWRSFFGPFAEINIIEYDKNCGEAWYEKYGKK